MPPTTQADFQALFLKHWDAGTRLSAHKTRPRGCWTTSDFVDAMVKADCEVSEDAVETWRNGKHTPRRPQMLAILDVFFLAPADNAVLHVDRQVMFDAWTAEQTPKAKRARTAPEPTPEPEAERAADWPRENPPAITGLVELSLLTPHADNETGGHRLRGRLVLGAREDDSTDQSLLLTIRPDHAFITVATPQGVSTDGSLIGVREAHDNVTEAPGGLRVVGPKASLMQPDGTTLHYIKGEVFDGSHLAVLIGTDPAVAVEVSVIVSVGKRGFDVTPLDENGKPAAGTIASEAKHALLNALLFSALPRDDQGRAVVQKATLRRRAME